MRKLAWPLAVPVGTVVAATVAALLAAPALAQSTPQSVSSGIATAASPDSADSGTLQRADKDMAAVLMKLQSLGAKPIGTLTVEQTRAQPTPADAVKAVLKDMGKDPVALMAAMNVAKKDMTYPTAGSTQPVRIYTPQGVAGPLPVIVYFHGGGWVIATIDTYEASAMALARKTGAIVASVEYRHAPEAKFPAAHEDAVAAYKWVIANAASFGGDPARIAVAGESAGGNLAANVAIAARDQNLAKPVYMLLVYPVAGTDMNTPSYVANQNAMPLSKSAMIWFVNNTLKSSDDLKDPRLNLSTTRDLKGLPPTTVITAGIDPLMSEGKALADRLTATGVPVDYQNFAGVTHEFFGMDAVVADAVMAQDAAASDLKAAFGKR